MTVETSITSDQTDANRTLTAITNAHIVPITAEPFDGTIVLAEGRIAALSPDVEVPAGAAVIDAAGGWVLPGLVDAHVHLGMHPEGEDGGMTDVNEMTNPVMAGVRAVDAVDPMDPGFDDALAGGVTTVNVNPGSGNPIGGQAVAIHTHGRMIDEMVLREPSGVKSALGENPKRVYKEKKQTPSTRLGTALVIREAFMKAQHYQAQLAAAKAEGAAPVARDPHLEALVKVLNREIPWRQHCHRTDDVATALRLAEEFGYELVLDHGTEAHPLADVLAGRGVPVLIGPLFTTKSKVELRGRDLANPGRLAAQGVEISIITDHPVIPIQMLITQATLSVKEGLDRDTALQAVTLNPARVLGLDHRIGSLEVGKDADVVLWTGDPLDVMQRAARVWIGGRQVMEYDDETRRSVVVDRRERLR